MYSRVSILELDNVTKAYPGGQQVLQGVSLRVDEGSVTGFIGLNGAGKTTTIRIIAGLLAADSGNVRVSGRETRSGDPEYKRALGFVLDEPLYFDWMDPREYLRFVGLMYGLDPREADRRCDELLEFFDLAEKRGDLIRTFSTGMKKKVSLAAAVIHKPRMLILDEPFEGIDALAASSIKEALKMMVERGMTVMITSHVLATIEKLCSHIAVIHHGKVILQGTTGEVKRRARNATPASGKAEPAFRMAPTKGTRRTGSRVAPKAPRTGQGNTGEQTLEELFIDLVSPRTRKKPLSYF
ncbi:ABC transporter ATP-binding protein [bacterium]|nr:MAG: ABC transporter ATP-binding protein [bacterium]